MLSSWGKEQFESVNSKQSLTGELGGIWRSLGSICEKS